jgi:hypothetical protein
VGFSDCRTSPGGGLRSHGLVARRVNHRGLAASPWVQLSDHRPYCASSLRNDSQVFIYSNTQRIKRSVAALTLAPVPGDRESENFAKLVKNY